jgi:hypothetical protein
MDAFAVVKVYPASLAQLFNSILFALIDMRDRVEGDKNVDVRVDCIVCCVS